MAALTLLAGCDGGGTTDGGTGGGVGGGSGGGGGGVQVATVEVTPATVSLTAGQTQQLTAVAKDSTGATLSGRTFTWASSATGVATVDATGLVSAVAGGMANLTASTGGVTSSPVAVAVTSGGNTVGPAGGTLSFLGGAVVMTFPAGALASETAITVTVSTGTTPSYPKFVPNTHYDFGPDGLTFAQPVTVAVRYDPVDVPADVRSEWLQLSKLVGPNWYPETSTVDTTAHTVTAQVRGFSPWAVTTFPGQLKLIRFPDNGAKGEALDFFVTSMDTDGQGNVVIAGQTRVTVDGVTAVQGGSDVMVSKYGTAFAPLWVKQLGTAGIDGAQSVGITGTGNIGVGGVTTGAFAGTAPTLGSATFITSLTAGGQTRAGWPVQEDILPSFGDAVVQLAGTATDSFVLQGQMDSSQAARAYLASYDSGGNRLGRSPIDVGAPGNIANSSGGIALNSLGVYALVQTNFISTPNPEWTGWGLTALDSSGMTRPGWPMHQGETITGRPWAVAADALGNVYVASDAATYSSRGQMRISSFTPDGMPRTGWPVEFDAGRNGEIRSMAVDVTGNLYVAGLTDLALAGTNAGQTDVFVTSFTNSGQLRANWPVQFGTPGKEYMVRLVVDPTGAVVLAGRLDVRMAQSPEGNDWFIARLRAR
ncbi:MAG: hypothetical protein AMXMBFR34_13320 [Myxococcaceae bacterium]